MNDQYYTREPQSESHRIPCNFNYRGHLLRFETDSGVFSKGELDDGTKLLLDSLPETLSGQVVDMGCGWGAIGVTLGKTWKDAHITMCDVNLRALDLCRDNAAKNGVTNVEILESSGFDAIRDRRFDFVITNPPIRAGKQVIYQMFADAANQLTENGELYLVIRKQQGAESCMKYLKTLFENVERIARDNGFWILRASGAVVKE